MSKSRRDSGYVLPTTLLLSALLCLCGLFACSLTGAQVKQTALDCGTAALTQMAGEYVPTVTAALADGQYDQILGGLKTQLEAKGVGDALGLIGCIVSHVLTAVPSSAPTMASGANVPSPPAAYGAIHEHGRQWLAAHPRPQTCKSGAVPANPAKAPSGSTAAPTTGAAPASTH